MKKSILLFTSNEVGFTGTVTYGFILAIEAAENHMDHWEIWGYIHQPDRNKAVFPFNLFDADGVVLTGAIDQAGGHALFVEKLPDRCSMLCTVDVADKLVAMLGDRIEIIRLFGEKTLTTS